MTKAIKLHAVFALLNASVVVVAVPASLPMCWTRAIGAAAVTVKGVPLVATPPATTMTLPLVAPAGTGTTILVALQLVGVAATPLNDTVPEPCEAPKPVPVIVTGVPRFPDEGLRLVIIGWTEKFRELL